MQGITPFLWFDGNAEEAAGFYTSVFPDARVVAVSRNTEATPGADGSVLVVVLELAGGEIMLVNGGSKPEYTDAMSLMVNCDTQDEVDHVWEGLSSGGEERPCGWLRDRFGVSWQITPRALIEMQIDPDRAKANRALEAMMTMKKLDIAELERAYRGDRAGSPQA
jgi:predicted 3-demethylubiquinone-9 3-methyltransferase (glyoxalase superfamily)